MPLLVAGVTLCQVRPSSGDSKTAPCRPNANCVPGAIAKSPNKLPEKGDWIVLKTVPGDPRTLKLTHPEDLAVAELLVASVHG